MDEGRRNRDSRATTEAVQRADVGLDAVAERTAGELVHALTGVQALVIANNVHSAVGGPQSQGASSKVGAVHCGGRSVHWTEREKSRFPPGSVLPPLRSFTRRPTLDGVPACAVQVCRTLIEVRT